MRDASGGVAAVRSGLKEFGRQCCEVATRRDRVVIRQQKDYHPTQAALRRGIIEVDQAYPGIEANAGGAALRSVSDAP